MIEEVLKRQLRGNDRAARGTSANGLSWGKYPSKLSITRLGEGVNKVIVSSDYRIQKDENTDISVQDMFGHTLVTLLSGSLHLSLTLNDRQTIDLYNALVDRRSRIAQKQLAEAEAGKWCTCTDPVHTGGDGCEVHGGKVPTCR